MLAELALVGHKIFHGSNLIAVHQKQTNVVLNKPIYVRASILDLSKYFMYNFYNHIKRKYGDRAKLCYTDTDSLIIKIETEDVYADMIEDADLYDFSDYPEEHPLLEKLPADQWVILPDGIRELKNKKFYALETEDEYKNVQKAKGLKKSLVKKKLTIDIYECCILDSVEDKPRTINFLRYERFVPYIIRQTKRSINPLDSNRWILNDRVTTWAIGDCRILAYLSALEKYGNNIPQEILTDLEL
ncbi:uncharacterized protein LOC114539624 [Rhizophagus clarus]|uniref:Uncharacterized protein LOC114539624 n=1 Tax=Rhizophagus clarus TaxID=94130 RepID=A0A8H3LNT2_9GLOM|nr:uncharacterized protein LOC114539624 [Rhizophagus clarus]